MKKKPNKRVMHKFSKEGIMVNKNEKRMNIEDLSHSGNKEALIMMKGST
jgi:hypothetical protein